MGGGSGAAGRTTSAGRGDAREGEAVASGGAPQGGPLPNPSPQGGGDARKRVTGIAESS